MSFRSFVLFSFLLLQLLLAKLAPYFKGFNSERLSDQAFMAFHLRELMKPSALKIAVVLLTASEILCKLLKSNSLDHSWPRHSSVYKLDSICRIEIKNHFDILRYIGNGNVNHIFTFTT